MEAMYSALIASRVNALMREASQRTGLGMADIEAIAKAHGLPESKKMTVPQAEQLLMLSLALQQVVEEE